MKKTIIVEKGENPTTDAYLINFMRYKGIDYKRVSHESLYREKEADNVFIVRYLSLSVIRWIEKVKPKKVFYFMDDDLLDWRSLYCLPFKYSSKLFVSATIYKRWIKENTVLLVSNKRLQDKYTHMKPLLLPPNPAWIDEESLTFRAKSRPFVVFYHATSSHKEEFPWLSNLISKIKDEDVCFEVVADDRNVEYFKNLKNVWIVRPIKWKSYIKFLQLGYRSLSLAINHPNRFNVMRTHIKFFNNLHSGVPGIYNTDFPESEKILHTRSGIVLPLDDKLWIEAILELKNSLERMKEMYSNATELYKMFRGEAISSYDKIEL